MRTLFAIAVVLLLLTSIGCPSKPSETARTEPQASEAGTPAVAPDSSAQASTEPERSGSTELSAPAGKQPTGLSAPPAGTAALPKLWDFGAEWCPPCREQKPIVHELEKEYAGKVEIRIIDVDENQDLAAKFGVKAIPTQVFLDKDGNTLSQHVGLMPKDSIVARFKAHGFIQ